MELRREENFRFLTAASDPEHEIGTVRPHEMSAVTNSKYVASRHVSPAYASGRAYSPNVIDPLMAQVLYFHF